MPDAPVPKSIYAQFRTVDGAPRLTHVSQSDVGWSEGVRPHRYVLAEVTDEMVDRALRAAWGHVSTVRPLRIQMENALAAAFSTQEAGG